MTISPHTPESTRLGPLTGIVFCSHCGGTCCEPSEAVVRCETCHGELASPTILEDLKTWLQSLEGGGIRDEIKRLQSKLTVFRGMEYMALKGLEDTENKRKDLIGKILNTSSEGLVAIQDEFNEEVTNTERNFRRCLSHLATTRHDIEVVEHVLKNMGITPIADLRKQDWNFEEAEAVASTDGTYLIRVQELIREIDNWINGTQGVSTTPVNLISSLGIRVEIDLALPTPQECRDSTEFKLDFSRFLKSDD